MKHDLPSFSQIVALYDAGQFDEAAALCHKVLERHPRQADSLRMLGVIARNAEQFDVSLDWLRQALAVCPHDPVLHFEHGTTLFQQGELEPAAADYQRAFELKPDFQEAALNLGAIFEQQSRFDEALVWSLRAVQLRPTCAKAHYNLGNIRRSLGQLAEAAEAYTA
ncbi:MAG TPA: tetratricopeptide repeat protein, partial [Pirellulales bacterium]|nr:tetratricopeptide repeat protein [Pirellulales bacterium]